MVCGVDETAGEIEVEALRLFGFFCGSFLVFLNVFLFVLLK